MYLVLEMCHNGEMSRYLKERKMPFSEDEGQAYVFLFRSLNMSCVVSFVSCYYCKKPQKQTPTTTLFSPHSETFHGPNSERDALFTYSWDLAQRPDFVQSSADQQHEH